MPNRLDWETIHAVEVLSREYERYQRVADLFAMVSASYKEGDWARILKTVNQRVDLLDKRRGEPMSKAEEWFQQNSKSNGEPKEE